MATEAERARYADQLAKDWADKGKLVEGGWRAFEHFYLKDVLPDQVEKARLAFYMGAHHIWGGLFMTLEHGERDEAVELKRMAKVQVELDAFALSLKSRHQAGHG